MTTAPWMRLEPQLTAPLWRLHRDGRTTGLTRGEQAAAARMGTVSAGSDSLRG